MNGDDIQPVEQKRNADLTMTSLSGMAGDVTTPKCTRMADAINAREADLKTAAGKLRANYSDTQDLFKDWD